MTRSMMRRSTLSACLLLLASSSSLSGCSTEAFCFRDCDQATSAQDSGLPDTNGYFDVLFEQPIFITDTGKYEAGCAVTNGGVEICDGKDNDCNGKIDDGFDLKDPRHCGTCENNCFSVLLNVDLTSISCDWDGTAGKVGTCKFAKCEGGWVDLNGNTQDGCEHACVKVGDDDKTCNRRDDDCDGTTDEDVDLCSSSTDCGKCGNACVVLHGTPQCVHTGSGTCDPTNTKCGVLKCDDDDKDGKPDWWDRDNSYANGCEYPCSLTNGGIEICGDGIDNDCDQKIDGVDDDLSGDPQLNQTCYGDPDGECSSTAHAGKTQCQGQKVVCVGAEVIVQGQLPEKCNKLDDDCDGVTDNNLTDVGKSCGVSNVFPCQLGAEQCVDGSLSCIGFIGPGKEICNGLDDDCNTHIDDNLTDVAGPCGQSDVGECSFGAKVCVGGTIICSGNIDSKFETCNGKDDDCDGTPDNNLTDVGASCGQSGTSPCKLGTIQCDNSVLKCIGATNPTAETCDGQDNDCSGTIDDKVPGAGASCGKSDQYPCKKGTMQCVGGAMVCMGAIDPKTETCNGVDDDCDTFIDNATIDSGGVCGLSDTAPCKKGALECHNGTLSCVGNIDPKVETCNMVDDDCDGQTDDDASGVNADCGKSNTAPCKYGKTACQSGALVCVGNVDPKTETCNNIDDNCDGTTDNNATGTGTTCGQSNKFPCSLGSMQCQSGALTCVGAVDPKPETCNGVDDNCDGATDKTGSTPPPDSTGACNVPPPAPPGATTPCKAGTKACVGGTVKCQGSTGPTSTTDKCGDDSNCDGQLTGQPNLQTDKFNCGTCGNDCTAGAVHANWGCVSGACVFQGCQNGYYDLNNDKKCEYPCVYVSAQEACNNADDDCDGQTDENVTSPSPVQVCGVSAGASTPECTSGVTVACQAGVFKCTFPAGVCSPTCSGATEVCDTLDNNCNGAVNENTPNYGKPCASDDANPVPGDGACRTTGTYVCSGPNATTCTAVKKTCASLPGGCTELCDDIDNDCDGLTDEAFNIPGTAATYYVKPAVTKISATRWAYSYEASRPDATTVGPGTGNGYYTSAPAGSTLDKTPACSVQGKIPWFNVTPTEVEQTCAARGGFICDMADWQTACRATASCTWGYAPRGTTCTTAFTSTKFCNISLAFDFNGTSSDGDQDGLLVTGSSTVKNCWADWSGQQGNTTATDKIYDITGNLREITKTGTIYKLLGGAFDSQSEAGSACGFTFYTVDQNFKFFDTGFRCCFSSNPSP